MVEKDIVKKIHSRGYWRVVIRPDKFKSERIESLGELKNLLRKHMLHLTGWNFPHLNERNLVSGQNFIESHEDFSVYKEFWRFYQSGQFLYLMGFEEDWDEERVSIFETPKTSKQSKKIAIDRILYNMTQIFEFAARLIADNVFENVHIEISLHDTENRHLYFWKRERMLNQIYSSAISTIKWEKSYSKMELLGGSTELALGATLNIFERFNWHTNPEIFRGDQQKLLSGRLPF